MPNHNIVTTGSAEYIPLSNVRLSNSDNFNYRTYNWTDNYNGYCHITNELDSKLYSDLITVYLHNKFPYKTSKEIAIIRKNVEKYVESYFNKRLEIE